MCKFCVADEDGDFIGDYLADETDGRLVSRVNVFPGEKLLAFNVDFGAETVTSIEQPIGFCLMCGRKL